HRTTGGQTGGIASSLDVCCQRGKHQWLPRPVDGRAVAEKHARRAAKPGQSSSDCCCSGRVDGGGPGPPRSATGGAATGAGGRDVVSDSVAVCRCTGEAIPPKMTTGKARRDRGLVGQEEGTAQERAATGADRDASSQGERGSGLRRKAGPLRQQ